jgi:hypothetical protein
MVSKLIICLFLVGLVSLRAFVVPRFGNRVAKVGSNVLTLRDASGDVVSPFEPGKAGSATLDDMVSFL